MSEIEAGQDFHNPPPPPGSTRDAVQADAPELLPILDAQPDIRLYTRSHPRFADLARIRREVTDMAPPLAIARPTNEAEIIAVVRHCGEEKGVGAPLAIRSGGNDMGERSRSDGGVVIDVRSLDHMVLAADRQSVRLGGGVNLGSLLKFLDSHALDAPCGWGYEVGYVAWACGGGYGLECGAQGLGVDQILGGRIVTSSGRVLEAGPPRDDEKGRDDAEAADVWWALRGGGAGVIGVVSELTIKVYPRPRAIAGYVWFPLSEAETVFGNMGKLYQEDFPDNFAGEVFVINPFNNGGTINHFFWWQLKDDGSDLEQAKAYHERLTQCGTVIHDTVRDKDGNYNETTPHDFLFSIAIPSRNSGRGSTVVSATLPSFSAELGAILARNPLPTEHSSFVLHNCHGRGTRIDSTAAFGNRQQHILIGIAVQFDEADQEHVAQARSWPNDVYKELQEAGLLTDWKYVNFNAPEKGDGKMYLGHEGVKRMMRVKDKWDPKGLFQRCTPDLGLETPMHGFT
nr:RNase T2 protein [Pestalotiopsis microspora]